MGTGKAQVFKNEYQPNRQESSRQSWTLPRGSGSAGNSPEVQKALAHDQGTAVGMATI